MTHKPSFISELRRRKVFRVAAAYAVVAFGVLQAVDLAVAPLRLPAWTMTLLWVLALAGFPIAVTLAWALQVTPEGVRWDEGPADAGEAGAETSHEVPAGDVAPAAPARAFAAGRRSRRAPWFALGVAVALSGAWLTAARLHHEGAELDRGLVAVVPFRVAAADPSLSYLREGMLDLLAAKLTGEGGPRAVEPRTLLAAWRSAGGSGADDLDQDAALGLARQLGAGGLLEGTVVGSASHLTLSASLLDARGGGTRARASVEGAPDSLPALVDRLAGQLLAGGAGEDARHLAALSATPLPALRAYLDGSVAYRRGAYQKALADYNRALELDSTFALAALGRLVAGNWVIDQETGALVQPAWSLRDRLSGRDRALLDAIAGPPGPHGEGPRPPSYADAIEAAQRAVQAAPDRPEAWNVLGDLEFHDGGYLGQADAIRRADAALSRAVELDSSYAVPLMHLVEVSIREGDIGRARRLADRFAAINPEGDVVAFVRWRVALAAHDTAALARLRAEFPRTSIQSLLRIIGTAELEAAGLEDARAAVEAGLARTGTPSEQLAVRSAAARLERAMGQPARAAAIMADAPAPAQGFQDFQVLSDAVFSDGSAAAADSALAAVWPQVAGSPPASLDLMRRWVALRTAAELWRIRRGNTSTAAETAARLRAARAGSGASPVTEMLAEAVDATAAVARGAPDARAALERLDRDVAAGQMAGPTRQLNLLAARLWEKLGEPKRALAAVRRREYHHQVVGYQADLLREEGRLAALTGDRRGAIEAYRRYLALRTDPEPSLVPEVEGVRRALARLVGE